METKVLHVIKTKSYYSDGRLLKWVDSLDTVGISSEVYILDDSNRRNESTANNTKIFHTSLLSRKIFKKGHGYLLKIPEYFVRSFRYISRSKHKIIVFHDMQHYLTIFVCILFKKRDSFIIWDLHEMPHTILWRFKMTKSFVRYMLEKVDLLVYTNKDRRERTLQIFGHQEKDFLVLNNYPTKQFINCKKASLPDDLRTWLNDESYILWMGAANSRRNFLPVLQVLSKLDKDIKLVVMGSIDDEMKVYINKHELNTKVFSKFVTQTEINRYVDNALFSIVLYRNDSLNNWYCEPNRLYQLLSRKIPVIVGANPPMKRIVEELGGGIVLADDGSNFDNLLASIKELTDMQKVNEIKNNLINIDNIEKLNWENQFENVTKKIINKI